MKNYKFLIPIVIIVMFVGSIYMLFDTKSSTLKEYNECLKSARANRELDVQVDAEKDYKRAFELKPSIDLSVEIGEFYRDSQQTKKAMNWGNTIIDDYPKQAKGYEFLIELYANKCDYVSCFKFIDKFNKRKLKSKKINELSQKIEYEFFYNCEFTDVGIFSENLCSVKNEGKWGYVNSNGDKVVANKYLNAGYYSGELCPVVDSEGKAFYIDPNGNKKKVLKELEGIKELGLISNGVFSAYDGTKWTFYNDKEKKLFGDFNDAMAMGNGLTAVEKSKKWLILDSKGKEVTNNAYDGIVSDEKKVIFRNDRIFVYDNLAYYMIDSSGKQIGEKYEGAKTFNDTTYAAVKIKDKWGFVDKNGKMIIEPEYEDARSFSNGFAAVKFAGKWGFIDLSGKMVIEPQFEDTKDFTSSGSVFVMQKKSWKLLRLYKYNH